MKIYKIKEESLLKDVVFLYHNNIIVNAKSMWKHEVDTYISGLELNGYVNGEPTPNQFDTYEFEQLLPAELLHNCNESIYNELFFLFTKNELKKNDAVAIEGFTAYKICTTTDFNVLESYKYLLMLKTDIQKALFMIGKHTF